jgi:internalin A
MPTSKFYIVGGSDQIPQDHPGHFATVGITSLPGHPDCTGVIIASNLIVTAGHCLPNPILYPTGVPNVDIVFGSGTTSTRLRATEWRTFRNRAFVEAGLSYDIAWVKFTDSLPEGYRPVTVVEEISSLQPGESLDLVGYGLTSSKASLDGIKRMVTTKLDTVFNSGRLVGILRYGPTPGFGGCRGDSGGPAFIKINDTYRLAGITRGVDSSLLSSIKCEAGEGLYTFVGYYKNWLEKAAAGHTDENSSAESWPTALPRYETFLEYCESFDLPYDAWMTVKQILAPYKTYDCRKLSSMIDAEKKLVFIGDSATTFSFEFVAQLKFLEQLEISKNHPKISDLTKIGNLKNLKSLKLSWQAIRDVTPLTELTELEHLDLDTNHIEDISALGALRKLKTLSVRGNPIKDKTCPLTNGICRFEYD